MRTDPRARLRPLFTIARSFYLSPRIVALSLALVLVVVAADVAMPWLVKVVIDRITAGHDAAAVNAVFQQVLELCGLILGVALLQYAATAILNRAYNRVVYRGSARLRETLYARMQAQSSNFLAQRKIGEILTHLITDIQNLQDSTLDLASEVPFDVCVLLGLMAAMLFLNPFLALVVIVVLGLSVVSAFGLGQRGWKAQTSAMEGTADLTARFEEGLVAARTIAAFDAAQAEQQRIEVASRHHTAHLEKSGAVHAAVQPFLGFAEYAGIVIVLIFGGWEMLHGSLTAGGLVAFLAYMELSADPMARFSRVIPRLQKAAVSAARLHDLLGETRDTPTRPGGLAFINLGGRVTVEQLHFRYPTGDRPALQGLDFAVETGERIAVVGRNGSGKSTFLDLLLRIQDPGQGRVLVDGVDLRDIGLASLRAHVGVVPQDILLLNRTVSENIALGSGASPAQIRAAAASAGLDEFINGLPHAYETPVGERGVALSGGERQRIAIARLFLRAPRLILLDEPTSALDAAYERELLPALQRLCAGRTTFIVSHRPALLADADKALLLGAGRQLAFDRPARLWRDFPGFRDLFPESWAMSPGDDQRPSRRATSGAPENRGIHP